MRIALGQINPVVGDIRGNVEKITGCIRKGETLGAELVVFGELCVVGYPPRDLLRKERFVRDTVDAVESLARGCENIAAVVGYVRPNPDSSGRPVENVAGLLSAGKVRHVHVKGVLPTYDVFDQARYFEPGGAPECFEFGGRRMLLTIGEELRDERTLDAEVIINISASPYQMGDVTTRESFLRGVGKRSGAALVCVNQVGGNDELIFDGGSCVLSPEGQVLGRAKSFEEDLLVVDTDGGEGRCEPVGEDLARLWDALKIALRDYVHKCGFCSVVLGLSGGIDSAVTAALAADALGSENVHTLAMPSRYSSPQSLADAQTLADNLGIHLRVIEIEQIHASYEHALGDALRPPGVADENVQARIRGDLLMGLSNAEHHLVLATGNKSELFTGYCTLYGDMVGGLGPLGDVPKTLVYKLARYLNTQDAHGSIPESVITRPPSAELRPNQLDRDKLPPYDVLDGILDRYLDQGESAQQIVTDGFDPQTVRSVIDMVDSSEHKRRQAPPVLKVTSDAFTIARRFPIAQKYTQTEYPSV